MTTKIDLRMVFCLSVLAFFFSGCGSTPVSVSLNPPSAMVFSNQTTPLIATDSMGDADMVWSIMGPNANSPVPTINMSGAFAAPAVTQNTTYTVTVTSSHDRTKKASATVTVLAPGQVAASNNPQVAIYTVTPPAGAATYIQFGTGTTYALKSWAQPAPDAGAPLSLFVAGMLASTQYHMRAVVSAPDGTQVFDADHTFTTPTIPNSLIPAMIVTTTPGATPQPGIEMLDMLSLIQPGLFAAYDLSGNLLWSYPFPGASENFVQGAHLLPNGHFIMNVAPSTGNEKFVLREIDLAGDTIREETLDALNASLAPAGFFITVGQFTHDVIALPSGHWIALVFTYQNCTGRPACAANPLIVGEALVDLAPQPDGTFLPVWFWNTFDHMDVNRAPMGVSDWTHSNAVLYSPDDGNLLLSVRDQSWIVKIDYNNGKGLGNIIWRLGYQGDFTLVGGNDPTDWFYAQHGPSFVSANTAGKFTMAIMDNGNDRAFPAGVTCGAQGSPPCLYSSALLMQIDETYKTATIVSRYLPGEYSFWGGDVQQLSNGNVEADFNAGGPGLFSDIFELIPGAPAEVVWHLSLTAQNAYRGFRAPSLYPGVQW